MKSKDTVSKHSTKIKNHDSAESVRPAAAVLAVMSARSDDLARECCVISAGYLSPSASEANQMANHPASQPVGRAAKRRVYTTKLCGQVKACTDDSAVVR